MRSWGPPLVVVVGLLATTGACKQAMPPMGPPTPDSTRAVRRDMAFVGRYARLLDDHLERRGSHPDRAKVLRVLDTLCLATEHMMSDPLTATHPVIHDRMPDFVVEVRAARADVEARSSYARAAALAGACASCHDAQMSPFLTEEGFGPDRQASR